MRSSLLLLFLLPLTVRAEPPKVVPVPPPAPDSWHQLKGAEIGKLFVLSAEPASKWRLETPGAELRVFDNGKSGVFLATAPGVYRLTVTGPAGDTSQNEIAVGGPGPKPEPTDALKEKMKAAFDSDKGEGATKQEAAKDLAELYRQAAALALKPEITTASDLLKRAKDAATVLIGADQLLAVRKVVSQELSLLLPTDSTLTDEQRKKVADLFRRLAVILDGF